MKLHTVMQFFGVVALACALQSGSRVLWAETIFFNTDNLTLNGISGGTFNGTPFIAQVDSRGAAQFLFQGDLNLTGDTLAFVGSRGASIIVGGNADLSQSVVNVSAIGKNAGPAGGGAGGLGGVGGWRGLGGFGGAGGAGGNGGLGGSGGEGGDGGDGALDFEAADSGDGGRRGTHGGS